MCLFRSLLRSNDVKFRWVCEPRWPKIQDLNSVSFPPLFVSLAWRVLLRVVRIMAISFITKDFILRRSSKKIVSRSHRSINNLKLGLSETQSWKASIKIQLRPWFLGGERRDLQRRICCHGNHRSHGDNFFWTDSHLGLLILAFLLNERS